ncbi:FecR family protein [Mangrovibacterium diazotrophicum]|uniref:FecR family protein n=1 Tax=Mangrovibacterium diazotrophicum TaxID=1261403 RepID=A0A419WAF6_9BACT|nr:FecR domain-containing protein [Mangrovibacterium diazotrophicum]RKD92404.1 FecR family protein [Mangrovibacterium diazotrophicum]
MANRAHKLDKLIDNYLNEKSSPEEKRLLDDFVSDDQFNLQWEQKEMGNQQEVFSSINNAILNQTRTKSFHAISKQQIRWTISVAASLLLLIGVYSWIKFTPEPLQQYSFSTEAQSDSLLLPDGSVIFLSPETELSYDNRFNTERRKVTLVRGNAFFKVARNPEKPFIISSGAIKTKVLGTSFNIHTAINGYRVTVHTGKVNVSSDSESVDLTPLEEVNYSSASGKLSVGKVSPAAISPWYNSDITLADQSLETILNLIEQKFNLDTIRVETKQLEARATVYIARDASLNSIVEQLNYITNLKFEIHGKEIRCAHATEI